MLPKARRPGPALRLGGCHLGRRGDRTSPGRSRAGPGRGGAAGRSSRARCHKAPGYPAAGRGPAGVRQHPREHQGRPAQRVRRAPGSLERGTRAEAAPRHQATRGPPTRRARARVRSQAPPLVRPPERVVWRMRSRPTGLQPCLTEEGEELTGVGALSGAPGYAAQPLSVGGAVGFVPSD